MAELILHELDPVVAERLSARARQSGATVEDEARRILAAAVGVEEALSVRVTRLFKNDGLGPDEHFPEFRGEPARIPDFDR